MGASSSCLMFVRFSDALVHILKEKFKIKHICKVLDDFLFIAETKDLCQYALDAFTNLAAKINLPLALHKTEGPTQNLIFLGIQIDTLRGELSIPIGKVKKYSANIEKALQEKQITFRELQSITGKLNFVSYIIPVGRCFSRRLYDLTINRSPNAMITLGHGAISDLQTWQQFLTTYNAKELYVDRVKLSSQSNHIFTDASLLGYGGTFQNEYFYGYFPPHWQNYDIQVKEFFPIFMLFSAKASEFHNKHLIIRTDNSSVTAAINRQTSKNRVNGVA